jgi:hypothetical protein
MLVDHYDADWSLLWWVRADGLAAVIDSVDAADGLSALTARYPHYRDQPPPGPLIAIQIARWTGWSAQPVPEARPAP